MWEKCQYLEDLPIFYQFVIKNDADSFRVSLVTLALAKYYERRRDFSQAINLLKDSKDPIHQKTLEILMQKPKDLKSAVQCVYNQLEAKVGSESWISVIPIQRFRNKRVCERPHT